MRLFRLLLPASRLILAAAAAGCRLRWLFTLWLQTHFQKATEVTEAEISSESMAEVVARVDELPEIDPADNCHMFSKQMKRLFFSMRERKDLDDEIMKGFPLAMSQVSNVLHRVEKRRAERRKTQDSNIYY